MREYIGVFVGLFGIWLWVWWPWQMEWAVPLAALLGYLGGMYFVHTVRVKR